MVVSAVATEEPDTPANVFVLGLDQFNRTQLEGLPAAQQRYRFVELLDHRTVRGCQHYSVEDWLERCRTQLDDFDGAVDAIVSFWDFPVTETAAVLCAERGLVTPGLESVLRCQHKLWSRELQRRVLPELTPDFRAVEPFDADAASIDLPLPFWLKPVRSFRSQLGFRIDTTEVLDQALDELRSGIRRLSEPLAALLRRVELPPQIARHTPDVCIAEELVGGRQCTLEGYARAGDVHAYGIVDSIRHPGSSSFARYRYPSTLPVEVRSRMVDATARMIEVTGFDDGPFNVEFFLDDESEHLWLLELNCRISQSHSELFALVDGVSHHQVMVDLALGREPTVEPGTGRHPMAAKCFLRSWEDGTVRRLPDAERIAEVERSVGDVTVHLEVEEGDRLSELPNQDSYSYELGHVYVAGADDEEIQQAFARCEAELEIEVEAEGGAS